MSEQKEGVIIKIENNEEPPLIYIRMLDGKTVRVYSVDDISILCVTKNKKITFAPFDRD